MEPQFRSPGRTRRQKDNATRTDVRQTALVTQRFGERQAQLTIQCRQHSRFFDQRDGGTLTNGFGAGGWAS